MDSINCCHQQKPRLIFDCSRKKGWFSVAEDGTVDSRAIRLVTLLAISFSDGIFREIALRCGPIAAVNSDEQPDETRGLCWRKLFSFLSLRFIAKRALVVALFRCCWKPTAYCMLEKGVLLRRRDDTSFACCKWTPRATQLLRSLSDGNRHSDGVSFCRSPTATSRLPIQFRTEHTARRFELWRHFSRVY